jgi:hypothetical protein
MERIGMIQLQYQLEIEAGLDTQSFYNEMSAMIESWAMSIRFSCHRPVADPGRAARRSPVRGGVFMCNPILRENV